jgi:peroxiredoxin
MKNPLNLILVAALAFLLAGAFIYVRRGPNRIPDETMINAGGMSLVTNYRKVLGTKVPPLALANAAGEQLGENEVSHGNVVLFFLAADCKACTENGEFFKSAMSARNDVRYFGVRPFDKDPKFDGLYTDLVPFKVYVDVDQRLTRYLGVRGVPVVVFLKDGNIKRIWGGIAKEENQKIEFSSWLTSF